MEERITTTKEINVGKVLLVLLYAAVLLAALIRAFSYFHLTNEDAWISFKYARNLADGFGLVSNPHGVTQEGYSNLTLVLILAFLRRLFGLDIVYASKFVGIASVLGIIALNYFILKLLFEIIKNDLSAEQKESFVKNESRYFHTINIILILGISVSNYLNLWATQGLETLLYSMIVLSVFCASIYALHTQKLGYFAIVAILSFVSLNTRPEGLMNFVVFLFVVLSSAILNRKIDKRASKAAVVSIAIYVALAVLLALFKLFYFGDLMSNPAHVKLALSVWFNRMAYFIQYFKSKGTFFSIIFALTLSASVAFALSNIFKARHRGITIFLIGILGFIGSQAFYVYYSGGDYMAYSRFMVTHYPFVVLLLVLLPFIASISLSSNQKDAIVSVALMPSVIALVYSGLVSENVADIKWFNVGFLSPYEAFKASQNHKISELLSSKLREQEYYATSECGYIPYMVKANVVDMIGLNQKEIARNFGYYDLNNTFYANRDYVLSRKTRIVTSWGHYRDENGKVVFVNSVAWFLRPYFESSFFLKNYEVNPPTVRQDWENYTLVPPDVRQEWGFYEWNGKFRSTNIIQWNNESNYDKLMFGFYPEESQMWIAPLARVLIKPNQDDNFINVEGYIPNISRYENSKNIIEIRYNDKAVGDKLFAKRTISRSGDFKIRFRINKAVFKEDDILLTLKGSPIIQKASTSSQSHSYIFKSIFFSKE